MKRALAKIPGLYQALLWITTWASIHLLVDNCWGHNMDIQRCDYTISWATLVIGITYLLVRWRLPCQVSCSWFCLRFVVRKAIDSALLRRCIFIWNSVSIFLLAIRDTWSYFQIFHSISESWIHSRILFSLVSFLNWWRHCRKIIHCMRDNVWLSLLVFYCMPQKLGFPLMYLPILGWDIWSVQQRLLQICISDSSVCLWVGIRTLEAVTPVGPLRRIVLVLLPFGWCLIVFFCYDMGT